MMGNPAYDARREAERIEAEKDKAEAESIKTAFEAITAFFNGKGCLFIEPCNNGTTVRFHRDG